MSTTLLDPEDLGDFPGAPFSEGVVDSAAAAVQRVAGWHIAPVVTETLTLDSDGGPTLVLPSLKVVSVTAVRNVTDPDAPVTLEGWRLRRASMTLRRACGWPCGTLEVDLEHGYEACPPDLLPVIASVAKAGLTDQTLASKSVGPFAESYRDGGAGNFGGLSYYTLPTRP